MTDISTLTADERNAAYAASRARSELEQTERAFDELRASFVEGLLATASDQAAERERLFLAVKVLDRVRAALRMTVSGGDVAKYVAEVRAIMDGRDLVA